MNEVLALVRSAVNSAYIDLFKVNLKGQAFSKYFSKYFSSVPWLDTLFLLHIGSLSMVVAISLILFSLFKVSNTYCTIRRKQFLRQITNGSFKLLSFNKFFFSHFAK